MANVADVIELGWALFCPECGRMSETITRVQARIDFECQTEGCTKHLSDYERGSIDECDI
jgi:hypothetical protein